MGGGGKGLSPDTPLDSHMVLVISSLVNKLESIFYRYNFAFITMYQNKEN